MYPLVSLLYHSRTQNSIIRITWNNFCVLIRYIVYIRCLKSMKTPKINVSDLFGTSLSSREQADQLYLRIKNYSTKVIVDFSDVIFISRSFADEFYKGFLQLNKIMMIQTVNGNQVICDMLNAVSQTQNGKIKEKVPYKMQAFSNKEELRKYLLSIE